MSNKRMTIEEQWDIIKDYGFFSTFGSFKDSALKKGGVIVFRKYTSYDWCKENIFIGTYQELKEWYKTNTEVPFYLQNYIGKKFSRLTIENFYVKFANDKKQIYTKCICDCGNEIETPFEPILKCNKRSCGCESKRTFSSVKSLKEKLPHLVRFWDYNKNLTKPENVSFKSKLKYWWNCDNGHSFSCPINKLSNGLSCPVCEDSIKDSIEKIYPEFCKRYWDYEKNLISPNSVSIKSTKKVWIKDNYGESHLTTPAENFKINNSTSFDEQAIYYYIKRLYPDAINRTQFITKFGEVLEIDIYIPTLTIAIEYDGYFWHKNKLAADNYKCHELNENGLKVIRIRECGLPKLDNFEGITLERKTKNDINGLHLHDIINKIVNYISNGNNSLGLTKEGLLIDRQRIYAQYKTVFKENNIADDCIMKFFDYEGNGDLDPQTIGKTDSTYVKFICPNHKQIDIRINSINFKENCKEKECNYCYKNICPFFHKRFNGLNDTDKFCSDCKIFKKLERMVETELDYYGSASYNHSRALEEMHLNQEMVDYYVTHRDTINNNPTEKSKFIVKYFNSNFSFLVYEINPNILKEILEIFELKDILFNFHIFDDNEEDREWLYNYLLKRCCKTLTGWTLFDFYFRGNANIKNLSKSLNHKLITILTEISNKHKDYYRHWRIEQIIKILDH